jgi:hypothetical protein
MPFAQAPVPAGSSTGLRPAEPGSASYPAGLSLEQYASLCVELAVEPAKAAETLLRYRLDAEQKRALDDHWQRRIHAEPGARARFDQAYTAYQQWYVASRQR